MPGDNFPCFNGVVSYIQSIKLIPILKLSMVVLFDVAA